MAVVFHVGTLTAGHYYSNCWHLNEMWYNWVAQPPLQATSIAVFKNDDGGEGDSFFPLMFWSHHTLYATCILLGRAIGLLGGSKVPVAEPRKKYGVWKAEAAKSGWRCRIKVGPRTHFSGSLSLFLPPLWVWLFPPVAFLPSVLHRMTGIFSSFCIFSLSLGLNDVTSIVVNQNKCCHERKAHGMRNGRPLVHSMFAYAVCFSGVSGRGAAGERRESWGIFKHPCSLQLQL